MTHPFEFLEAVYCTLGEALSAQPMAKFPFFFALKWCISTFPACLANLSHRVSWQPSRGFPALVSTITFKCVVGGDAPLSVLLASNSEVCLGPREEPGSQSQSDPSGSCHPVPGGVS